MIGFAIVGFGGHAVKRLIPAFQGTKKARLVAIQKRERHSLRQAMDAFGVPGGFTDVSELANHPEIDAVYIASPPGLHKMQAIACARAGKHLLVEKPLATHAGEVKEMIAAAAQHKVKLCPAFCMRFTHAIQRTRQIFAEGKIGFVRAVDARFTIDASLSKRAWINDPVLSGGGPVADLGAHLLDLIEYVLDDRIVDVFARLRNEEESGVEKSAAVSMVCKSGTIGTMQVSFELPKFKQLVFYGSTGTLTVNEFSEAGASVDLQIRRENHQEIETITNRNNFATMIDAFAEAILADNPPPVAADDGLRNQTLIDRIYRSAQASG